MAEVTWYHVELETHEVLVANGAAAESWLDCGNRPWFQNAPVAMLTVPGNLDAVGTGWNASRACAPLVHGGDQLARIRAALNARAEALATTAPDPGGGWIASPRLSPGLIHNSPQQLSGRGLVPDGQVSLSL